MFVSKLRTKSPFGFKDLVKFGISYTKEISLPYPSRFLFDIVKDFEGYKEFVPYCEDSTIEERISETEYFGKLTLDFKVSKREIMSRVTATELGLENFLVQTTADSDILKYFTNEWKILSNETNRTIIKYNLEFEIKKFLYRGLAPVLLDAAGEGTITAFEKRASFLYSNSTQSQECDSQKYGTATVTQEIFARKQVHNRLASVGIASKLMKPRRNKHSHIHNMSSQQILGKFDILSSQGVIEVGVLDELKKKYGSHAYVQNATNELYDKYQRGNLSSGQLERGLKEILQNAQN